METDNLSGTIYDAVVPVFSGKQRGRKFDIRQCHGTAFSLGGGLFMTAQHVMQYAIATGDPVVIGHHHSTKQGWGASTVSVRFEWPGIDICVIKTRDRYRPEALPWAINELERLRDMDTVGYPFAIDEEHAMLTPRSFNGYVVAVRPDIHHSEHAPIVELSFSAPLGLSGAPLLSGNMHLVAGVIIGNSRSEIGWSTEETVETAVNGVSATKTIYEHRDFMAFGNAIAGSAIVNRKIGRNTVGTHVQDHGGHVNSNILVAFDA